MPDYDRMTRFLAKTAVDAGGHWMWTGARCGKDGRYGHMWWSRDEGNEMAHRAAWRLFVGPIGEGLQIDHLCRVTLCVRPDHLEPVTGAENLARGENVGGARPGKQYRCGRCHRFSGAVCACGTEAVLL